MEAGIQDEKAAEIFSLRGAVLSSSTKKRRAWLAIILEEIQNSEVTQSYCVQIVELLFKTYPYYNDRHSRRAVQACLQAIFQNEQYASAVPDIVKAFCSEASKNGLAPSNAFVLVELGSIFLSQVGDHPDPKLVQAFAGVLELCVCSGKATIRQSAVVVTRRAIRQLCADATIAALVSQLSGKDQPLGYRTAILLGVIAGVCARRNKPALIAVKHQYYAFYLREILGSRQPVPKHIASALDDFFSNFATRHEVGKEIVPTLEKALLRAPEVLLGLLPHLVESWPQEIDTGEILAKNLLRPLLSNAKSQNGAIRNGTILGFAALAEHASEGQHLGKVAEEISASLSKANSADQRSIHAQMLGHLPSLQPISASTALILTQTASKEPNEAALEIEISALRVPFSSIFLKCSPDPKTTKAIVEAFVNGLGEKKPSVKKTWAVGVGEFLWKAACEGSLTTCDCKHGDVGNPRNPGMLANEILHSNGRPIRSSSSDTYKRSFCPKSQAAIFQFMESILPKLLQIFEEVLQNPLTAGHLAVAAYILRGTFYTTSNIMLPETIRTTINKAKVQDRTISLLFNHRVYNKINPNDYKWVLRALVASAHEMLSGQLFEPSQIRDNWGQTFLYLIAAAGVPRSVREEAISSLTSVYIREPAIISNVIIDAMWSWYSRLAAMEKDTAASAAKTSTNNLFHVLRSIFPPNGVHNAEIMTNQLINVLVLCRPEMLPRANWIEICLRVGQDPGLIAQRKPGQCMRKIDSCFVWASGYAHPASVDLAAYNAAAELAFVSPDAIIPLLVERIELHLPADEVALYDPTAIAIARTPEGTAFIDVLSSKGQAYAVDKNSRDYDNMKWEEEIRSQIAQKTGQDRKLTTDERAKINAQLAKESIIRQGVHRLEKKLRVGVGFLHALAVGPPTDTALWFGPSLRILIKVIVAGAGRLIGHAADEAFLACSKFVSPRLGSSRRFVGIATLRALGSSTLPGELLEEPLGDLVTRLLYRLRSASEQRAFDSISLIYLLPLVFTVLRQSGIGKAEADEADEQVTLALEILSYHTDIFSDEQLPRDEIIALLVESMQHFSHHYKLIKDCLSDLCRAIADNAGEKEILILLKGAIVPQTSVRTAVLQAIREHIDLTDFDFCEEIWIACHDDFEENVDLGHAIWQENALEVDPPHAFKIVPYLASKDRQLRRAASRAMAEAVGRDQAISRRLMDQLGNEYRDLAKPRVPERDAFGMIKKTDLTDPWENRSGIAAAFKAMAPAFEASNLVAFVEFLIKDRAVGDRNPTVRDEMIDSATTIIGIHGAPKVEELMKMFESALDDADTRSTASDLVNEAVVILYGALAGHLKKGDERVPKAVQRLLATLDTPSETVQYAVAGCLPPLVQTSSQKTFEYAQYVLEKLLQSKKYAVRRGAAYGLAGIVKGKGVSALREYRITSTLKSAIDNKKDQHQRQGALFAYELLALILGRTFEPYIIQIVPQLLVSFGDAIADVREACLDTSKTCFANLSSYGVKIVLPTLLEGLEESQWRSKKGACDLLGAMAYLDPQQLALSLPDIIPPLTSVLNDSHKEVRSSANRSLQRFGEVISNPEIKGLVNILLKALSDPTKHTEEALDALIKVSFIHYLDPPSLALIVRILERALGERSASKRKAAQIIGSLAHLTERKDVTPHLPILVTGLKIAVVDPVPATRATASKALGSLVEKLGEDALPDLIPSLMSTLKSDTGAGDRLGSAQALSEVLAGLGTSRLEETLPTILQNISSPKATVREGFMSLFIYLPACFGNSFASYLSKIIPPILSGLADEVESIRETSLRAGRLLVKNFATKAIDLLLPELDRGLADDSYRIRLSSVELVGDLLFNLTGISGKSEQDEEGEDATEAGQSLLEVLGEDKRNRILSSLYICRCDTSGLVRSAAINVWKALVATPRTLKELVPTLTQILIRRLASSNMEQKVIAGNALGELIRKAGEGVLASLLPALEEGLQTSTDTDNKQGICIALREIISSASPEALEDYEKILISVVRVALVDADDGVREAAAEAFDSLQHILGKKAIDQVLPYLLNLLRDENEADTALSALLTLLTDHTRSNIILPNLVPTLLISPITPFNAKAIASLSEVAGPAMTRRLPTVLDTLMDTVVICKDDALRSDLEDSFDTILLSVDEFDGLNTAMSVMLSLVKNNDHRKRATANLRLSNFFAKIDVDIARYHQDLIRVLLISFDDSDADVVKSAWMALSELTKRLKKEEMEGLVLSTRQILQQVGVPGANLPGFLLPKGINAILPIFLQGLMNGTADQRVHAALAISEIIDRTNADSLKPFVTQITGPLIRVVSERSVDVKSAIIFTLNNLLEKIPTFLKPFLPQLQRTFAKCLADTSSDVLRSRAAKALGTLITLTPRIDPLIAELVTGSKTVDTGVRNAMLKALCEVVSKAGATMGEGSRSSVLGLIDEDTSGADGDNDHKRNSNVGADFKTESMMITHARLLGAVIKSLPPTFNLTSLIKTRVLTTHMSDASVLNLNSVLLEAPAILTESYAQESAGAICQGIRNKNTFRSDNSVLAAGKYLLIPKQSSEYELSKSIIEALASAIAPGGPLNTRRLALVVIRTVSRKDIELISFTLPTLVPPIFASVRDPVIPVKLAAEAAFLSIFSVTECESEVFDRYMVEAGAEMNPTMKRSIQDYFKRVALRLGTQAREQKEAEGGQGGLGLSNDEREDEREIWSIGKVELGDDSFNDA